MPGIPEVRAKLAHPILPLRPKELHQPKAAPMYSANRPPSTDTSSQKRFNFRTAVYMTVNIIVQ